MIWGDLFGGRFDYVPRRLTFTISPDERVLRERGSAQSMAEERGALRGARFALEKFGGDSILELKRNYDGYCQQLRNF